MVCAVVVFFVGYISVDSIIWNFGDGLPYYCRTPNMVKWDNPIPTLLVINAATAFVVFLVGKLGYRSLRRSSHI